MVTRGRPMGDVQRENIRMPAWLRPCRRFASHQVRRRRRQWSRRGSFEEQSASLSPPAVHGLARSASDNGTAEVLMFIVRALLHGIWRADGRMDVHQQRAYRQITAGRASAARPRAAANTCPADRPTVAAGSKRPRVFQFNCDGDDAASRST